MSVDVRDYPWTWYWREAGDHPESVADCGITCESRPGHGYSVVRCPRYVDKETWEKVASHICDLHNENLK